MDKKGQLWGMNKMISPMRMKNIIPIFLIVFLSISNSVYSEENEKSRKNSKFKFEIKHKNIYASNSLSGNGSNNATSYDMSIYESSLYRNSALLDNSIYFTNPSYPLISGTAFTSETFFTLKYKASDQISAGLSAQLYSNSDSDHPDTQGTASQRISRVFGVSQPLGNWTSITQNSNGISSVQIPHFHFGLWNLFLQGTTKNSNWKFEVGSINLNMGKGINKYLDSDVFIFRTPVNQMSIFGHFTRQGRLFSEMEYQQRMPGYGVKLTGNIDKINYEIFSLKNDETPITIGQIYSYSGIRAGIADKKYRLFLDAIHSNQNLFGSSASDGIHKKSENIFGLEYEQDFTENFAIYGSSVISQYKEHGNSSRNFDANAYLGGIVYKPNDKFTVGIKYQHLDPNYEPIGHHKNSVYIYNYKGLKTELKYTWATELEKQQKHNQITLSYSDFSQVDASINKKEFARSDYIFPDLTPDIAADAGKIKILSPEFNIQFRNLKSGIGGYYEKLSMEKNIINQDFTFHRQADNYSLWANIDFTKQLELILGYREVNFSGEWMGKSESYISNQKCSIPKIGLSYDNETDLKISAHVHFYDFKDFSAKDTGIDNDWKSTLFLLETKLDF